MNVFPFVFSEINFKLPFTLLKESDSINTVVHLQIAVASNHKYV